MNKLIDTLRSQGVSEEEINNIFTKVKVLTNEIQRENNFLTTSEAAWIATKKITGLDIQ